MQYNLIPAFNEVKISQAERRMPQDLQNASVLWQTEAETVCPQDIPV